MLKRTHKLFKQRSESLGELNGYVEEMITGSKTIAAYGQEEKIIEEFHNKPENTPLFVFNVTMQNHSSYTEDFDNFTPDITVNNTNSKALNNYLSLMKISDEAIKKLICYFSEQDEDTIIVFFGDHQPTNSVISPFRESSFLVSSIFTPPLLSYFLNIQILN